VKCPKCGATVVLPSLDSQVVPAPAQSGVHINILGNKSTAEHDAPDVKSPKTYVLLRSSESDVDGIATSGTNLVVVAKVNSLLYFRIFDAEGKRVVDTNESHLTSQSKPIAHLKTTLDSL
jgi:hypothetical protein